MDKRGGENRWGRQIPKDLEGNPHIRMVLRVRVLTTKPNDPSSIPEKHIKVEETSTTVTF